jgi:hypothetical protein
VCAAAEPGKRLLEFLETTYEAGAELGGWDRPTLERGAPAEGAVEGQREHGGAPLH